MPTYEFECTECGNRFDIFMSISEPQPTHCTKCRGKLEKVFYPVGIMFKGSGFYVNDNKSASNGAVRPVDLKAVENASANGDASKKPDCSITESSTAAGSK